MATIQKLPAPMPDKFWPHSGEQPPLKWDQWKVQLDIFFTLLDSSLPEDHKLSNAQKNMYLSNLLGAEGTRMFSAHPVASTFAFAAAAKSIFGRPINAIRAHFDFNMRKQDQHESIQDYILALRALMTDCTFHGQENYHLAIQLATGSYSKDTQTRLLAQQNIDLDEFTRIAEAEESSAQNASSIRCKTHCCDSKEVCQ